MAALDPAIAAIRSSLRRADLGLGTVFVACSGGADSLALAAGFAFVAPRRGLRPALVTVDHGLQIGSRERADAVAMWAAKEGFDPVVVERVGVRGRPGGPEAAARDARYEALVRVAREHGSATVLLGHAREDQAETVLLALLRGGGLRGLAGMPERRERDGVALVRPLLDVSRAQTRAACAALGLEPWDDPHNTDRAFARARARMLLQSLVDELGEAVVGNLARTARLAAADAALLDEIAGTARTAATEAGGSLRVADLAGVSPALRTRVLHDWVRGLGVPGAALSHRHVTAMNDLVENWHGQGAVHLPGGVTVVRADDRLTSRPPGEADAAAKSGADAVTGSAEEVVEPGPP
jgi:tRNA(Ile)-lysidine synthase